MQEKFASLRARRGEVGSDFVLPLSPWRGELRSTWRASCDRRRRPWVAMRSVARVAVLRRSKLLPSLRVLRLHPRLGRCRQSRSKERERFLSASSLFRVHAYTYVWTTAAGRRCRCQRRLAAPAYMHMYVYMCAHAKAARRFRRRQTGLSCWLGHVLLP